MEELRIKLDIYYQIGEGYNKDNAIDYVMHILDNADLSYQIYETKEQ